MAPLTTGGRLAPVQVQRQGAEGDDAEPGDRDGEGGDDRLDVVVLPWWQRPFNIVVVVIAAALLAGMLGWLVGQASNDTASSDVDTGFLQDMRVHHEQAIDMGFIFLRRPGTDPRLRTVAESIIFGQGVEIGLMIELLDDLDAPGVAPDGRAMAWMGHAVDAAEMPGMASEADLDRLTVAEGATADAVFAELMTAHHEGGMEMAEEAAERAANDEVRRLAASTARNQRSEIAELAGLLPDPAES